MALLAINLIYLIKDLIISKQNKSRGIEIINWFGRAFTLMEMKFGRSIGWWLFKETDCGGREEGGGRGENGLDSLFMDDVFH